MIATKQAVFTLGNFEDAPEGAQGADMSQADDSYRNMMTRHRAMVARMARRN